MDSSWFWERVEKKGPDDCWFWKLGLFSSGYGQLRDGSKKRRAHRVAYELTYGPLPPCICVLHHCDNRPCCNPAHLFLGTHGDNARDRKDKGRSGRLPGEDNPAAKLSSEQVAQIRDLAAKGKAHKEVGIQFDIHYNHVGRIVRGERWTNG